MSFKENKYVIIKNAISEELAKFCYDYFLLKRKVGPYWITNTTQNQMYFDKRNNSPRGKEYIIHNRYTRQR